MLTLKYSYLLPKTTVGRGKDKKEVPSVIHVGRVKSCVLSMITRKEREIAAFTETKFYKIADNFLEGDGSGIEAIWKNGETSSYFGNKNIYDNEGFLSYDEANKFAQKLNQSGKTKIINLEKKTERKEPPLLYNLAEAQAEATKRYKLSPARTLEVIQSLYEKKMVTYPRTDARVISTAVAKEITKNIKPLNKLSGYAEMVNEIIDKEKYKFLSRTKYVNDKKITDHYAIIPTGQKVELFKELSDVEKKIYLMIVNRFLQIFFGSAIYESYSVTAETLGERFYSKAKELTEAGWMIVEGIPDKIQEANKKANKLKKLQQNNTYDARFTIKEGKTQPPKRYTSGSLILAMENAGQFIEDEELRAQIKGSGIGTSATRAQIIENLVKNGQIMINSKTQIVTPTFMGEIIYEIISFSIPSLLSCEFTASWERGLEMVAEGKLSKENFKLKFDKSVEQNTNNVKSNDVSDIIKHNLKIIKMRYIN